MYISKYIYFYILLEGNGSVRVPFTGTANRVKYFKLTPKKLIKIPLFFLFHGVYLYLYFVRHSYA